MKQRDDRFEIAVYGKGGIGKSTISANLSAALALLGEKVLQIGCDPKHDSTRLLMHGEALPTVLSYLRGVRKEEEDTAQVMGEGAFGVGCMEAGGPEPGVGCAGRGIISSFDFIKRHRIKDPYDLVVYDVLGDVVCGGFAVPVRREYADAVLLVTSGEFMSIYAANNILRGIRNIDGQEGHRVAGIIYNERKVDDEDGRISRFAKAVGLPILAKIPRSDAFAVSEKANLTILERNEEEANKWIAAKQGSEESKTETILEEAGSENPKTKKEKKHKKKYKKNRRGVSAAERRQEARAEKELVEVFLSLSKKISSDLPLYEADPLSDEALEAIVFGGGEKGKKKEQEESRLNHTMSEDAQLSLDAPLYTEERESQTSERRQQRPGRSNLKRPPLYGCAFSGAATSAVHLRDAIVIAHSPKSCAYFTWQNISSAGRKNLFHRGILMPSAISPNFESTEIDNAQAVFGGMDSLEEKVKKAVARKPGAVIIVSSCVSGIIGDDIRQMEKYSTAEVPVIAIEADGDISGDYMSGIELCMKSLAKRLFIRDYQNFSPAVRKVNLIAETSISNNSELNYLRLKRLLERMNIEISCRFLGDATAEEMRHFLEAPLNILAVDSQDGRKMQAWLTEVFGCRFMEEAVPIGFHKTAQWLRKIGDFFECQEQAETIIEEEEKVYHDSIDALRSKLAGKKILMTTINTDMDWLLSAVREVGMEIVWVGVLNYLHQDLVVTHHKEDYPMIEESFSWEKVNRRIQETEPDIVLSNYTSAVNEGDYLVNSMAMTQVTGFHSGVHLLRRWAELLDQKEGSWIQDRALFEKYYR